MDNDYAVNILIVDDLPDKLLALEAVLDGLGARIVTARSGQEALRRLNEHDFAVILLDVNMPDMDGFETAALLRQRKKFSHIPIIFITAYADEIYTARGYSIGAVDYILSPVVPEILRTKVGVFIELYKRTQEAKRYAEERIALEREQMARAAAEEAMRRSALLVDAGAILASTLEYDTLLPKLLQLLVPRLGDLGAVVLTDEQGRAWQSVLAWVDPYAAEEVRVVSERASVESLPLGSIVRRVLASGTAEWLAELSGESSLAPDPAPEGAANPGRPQFPLHSAMVVPLISRRRVLGALLLATGPSGRHYQFSDVALAEDLGERTAMAMDNAGLYRSIQERDKRKNEFLSMLAHELRNPLAPIRNAVRILQTQGPADPQLLWARDVIDRQSQQIVRMVDDLLDLARITSGKIKLQDEVVNLADVVASAVETSRPLIDARKHQLIIHLPQEPVLVNGDSLRLAQIFTNLLNNAAKYTEEGGRIELTAERAHDQAVVRVRDSGVGISSSMLSSIFDLFRQADRSLDRSEGGLGIGLTLVRQLVEMHNGTVTALSAGPNRGSEFIVHLPALAEMPAPLPSPNGKSPAPAVATPCRILVVDDNVDSASSLAVLLRLEGYDVQIAHAGPAALEMADEFHPEVILLDIGLPEMDGYDVARRIRENPSLANAKLIAVTGYGQEEDRRRADAAGFDHHVVKPVDMGSLHELIQSKSAEVAAAAF